MLSRLHKCLKRAITILATIFVDWHLARSLLEWLRVLDQDPACSLRVQKADHSSQAAPRLLVYQLNTLGPSLVQFAVHVFSFKTNMMQTATTARQKFANPVVGHNWLQQLDLTFPGFEQRSLNPLVLDDCGLNLI